MDGEYLLDLAELNLAGLSEVGGSIWNMTPIASG
jgi:hypothetical protein